MLNNPSRKYRRARTVPITNRQWPDQVVEAPPVWCSVDLRDGNQALIEPMDPARKQRMFDELVRIGFKEVEVGFPSASQTDFDFVRQIIERDAIPEDVTIQVLTQARADLIARTFEALKGVPRAIVHVYHATAPVMRRVVFGLTEDEVIEQLALPHVRQIRALAEQRPESEWTFQYSPEMFSDTELSFAARIVDAVTEVWDASPERRCIINLPSTVENCTPNVFADMIEWMDRNLARRDGIVLSVHPHNDRGTGTAAAEQALMAGADRLEGCLFGNGERTGNLDIVNVAMNLYTQGIHPGLDFSNIDSIRDTVEHCNRLPVHPRHPYVGDLVYTSFSGSHQDAIKKALGARREDDIWEVPYLPVDPKDLGRSYQAVIRVNSQSGKGGITYLLEQDYGVVLPRRAQIDFSQAVQQVTDAEGGEMTSADLWRVFSNTYLEAQGPFSLTDVVSEKRGNEVSVTLDLRVDGRSCQIDGVGETAAHAVVAALNTVVAKSINIVEVALTQRAKADASWVCSIEIRDFAAAARFGVGLAARPDLAAAYAVVSACNRAELQTAKPGDEAA
ncbi:MAG: 2-isopropylmalate synthase [Pseudomonadota bacterium]